MLLYFLFFWHWVADFVCQSDWMAVNKSKNSLLGCKAMAIHIGVYTAIMMIPFDYRYALINGFLHLVTDSITSRLTTYFYMKENRHAFFVVIGFDQFIHISCLLFTA